MDDHRSRVLPDTERLLLATTVAVLHHACNDRAMNIIARADRTTLEEAVHHLTHLIVIPLDPRQRSVLHAGVRKRLAGLS